jgi:hypothetical protein
MSRSNSKDVGRNMQADVLAPLAPLVPLIPLAPPWDFDMLSFPVFRYLLKNKVLQKEKQIFFISRSFILGMSYILPVCK